MLVLTRKRSQRIRIGEEITITVVSIDRGHVRLGIEAPPQVAILRDELILRADAPPATQEGPQLHGRENGFLISDATTQ
jgi:carbon storage regulator